MVKENLMNIKFTLPPKRGQTLIELILIIGIMAIILPALFAGFLTTRASKPQTVVRERAIESLKEVEAAVRNIQNTDWPALNVNGIYHTEISNSKWILRPATFTDPNGLTQSIEISDVYRDVNGKIVLNGGDIDPATKRLTISISWDKPRNSQIQSEMFVVNTRNFTALHTSVDDFNPGIFVSTVVANTSGGEVILEQSSGASDWCKPQESVVEAITLPKKGNAIYSPAVGKAYIASGDGLAGESFINASITYPPPPASPSASILATHNGNYKTNSIFSDDNYAYLAIDGSSDQVRIINISSQPYTQVGTINLPSNTNANGIFVDGNTAYVTSSNKLYKVDVTNKNGSHAPSSSKNMTWNLFETALAKQVVVVENRVFVAVEGVLFGLQIYNKQDLKLYGIGRPNFRSSPQGLYVKNDGSRAYVVFSGGQGAFQRGFFIVNTIATKKESLWIPSFAYYYHRLVGSYNTGSLNPTSMSLAPDGANRALLGGIGSAYKYQVIDISNESNPVFCGGLDIPSGVTGVSGALDQFSNAYSFILTGTGSKEFKIIKGGAGGGGGGYAGSGTFESTPINASQSAVFNRFKANVNKPSNTQIQLQIGIANVGISGTCTDAQFTYIGPDKSTSTYFEPNGNVIEGAIPLGDVDPFYENPGQCLKYKTYYTNSNADTPILYDFLVNYTK